MTLIELYETQACLVPPLRLESCDCNLLCLAVNSSLPFISFASFVFFFGIVFYTLFRGARVTENNPWNEFADTLEWTVPCPPPEHTFETLPKQEDWDKSHAH